MPDLIGWTTLAFPIIGVIVTSFGGVLGTLLLILTLISGTALTFLYGVPFIGVAIVGGAVLNVLVAFIATIMLVSVFGLGGVSLAWVFNIGLLLTSFFIVGFIVFGVVGTFQFITVSGWTIVWLIGLVLMIPTLLALGIFGYFFLSSQLSVLIGSLF